MKTTHSTRRVLLLSALSTLLLGVGPAFAQVSATQIEKPVAPTKEGPRQPRADGPGKRDFPRTREDALADAAKRFDQVDADKDGTVTREEIRTFRSERAGEMRKKMEAQSSAQGRGMTGPDGQRPPSQGQREQPPVRPAP